MEFSIETVNLTKNYGDTVAVDDLNLEVPRGSFYGFLGPNGAGKSTTIKMLTGLTGVSQGSARILGYDLQSEPTEIKKRFGVVPENLCLFENLTAREYLMFIGKMYLMKSKIIEDRSDELLSLMGLADAEKTLVLEYSHGMKKKLSLAAALIHDPELLFLDEPFEGIDPIASKTIKSVLERFIQRESTIFLTSHIMEIVEKLCSHIGIIQKGRLVYQGPFTEMSEGDSLEDVFVNAVGQENMAQTGLSWLENNEDVRTNHSHPVA